MVVYIVLSGDSEMVQGRESSEGNRNKRKRLEPVKKLNAKARVQQFQYESVFDIIDQLIVEYKFYSF